MKKWMNEWSLTFRLALWWGNTSKYFVPNNPNPEILSKSLPLSRCQSSSVTWTSGTRGEIISSSPKCSLENESFGHRKHWLVTRREFVCRHLCGQPFDFLSTRRPLFQIPNFIATSEWLPDPICNLAALTMIHLFRKPHLPWVGPVILRQACRLGVGPERGENPSLFAVFWVAWEKKIGLSSYRAEQNGAELVPGPSPAGGPTQQLSSRRRPPWRPSSPPVVPSHFGSDLSIFWTQHFTSSALPE